MACYSLASAFWEHATHAEVLSYTVPTDSPTLPIHQNDHELSQKEHAISSSATFPPSSASTNGFIVSRLIEDRMKLELSWVQFARLAASQSTEAALANLDQSATLPSVRFLFPSQLVHQPVLSFSEDGGLLCVHALTSAGTLFRLTFAQPKLFYADDLGEWAEEWQVDAIEGKTPVLLEAVDEGRVVICCEDGSAFAVTFEQGSSMHVTELRPSSSFSLRSLVPSFSSRSLSAAAAAASTSAPTQLVSVAAGPSYSFGVSRDRKLKIWSLDSGACLKAIDLPRPASAPPLAGSSYFGSAAGSVSGMDADDAPATPRRGRGVALLPAAPQSLVKLLAPPLNSHFAATLLVFVPAHAGAPPAFFLYGVRVDSSGAPNELAPLGERECAAEAGRGRLVDFDCARLGLAGASQGSTIWAVWEEAGESEVRTCAVPELDGIEAYSGLEDEWAVVSRAGGLPDSDSGYFDGLLADDPAAVARVFASHVSHPGRYSPTTLDHALTTYEKVLTDELVNAGAHRPIALDTEYDSTFERVCAVVGCAVNLEHSAQTGAPMYTIYHSRLKLEWLRFVAMLEESRAQAMFPVALAVDPTRGCAFALARDAITVPIVLETAGVLTTLTAQQGQHAAGRRNFLSLPQTVVARVYPHLAAHDTRQDVFAILGAAAELEAGLSGTVSRFLESRLLETVRLPLAQNVEDVVLELYVETLEPSIEAERVGLVSEKLKAVHEPDASFHALWELLTTPELIAPQASSTAAATSDLAQVLLADQLASAIEARYQLAKAVVSLLLFVWAEEAPLLSNMAGLTSSFLATLHTLASLRWTALQTATPIDAGQEEDVGMLERFGDMNVSSRAEESSMSVPPFSLLHGLLRDRAYSPKLAGQTVATALPSNLTHAGSSFLRSLGLICQKRLVIDAPSDVEFGLKLVRKGLPSLATEFIEMYPQGAGMQYALGSAYLETGTIDAAETAFIRAAPALFARAGEDMQLEHSSDLSRLLPTEVAGSLGRYYAHVAALFGAKSVERAVAKFAALAIEALEEDEAGGSDSALLKELWLKLFRSEAALGEYSRAYTSLIANPYPDTQSTCLAHLISVMCENHAASSLIGFSFPGLQSELERHLGFRARNSDPRAEPNYFKILYGYHIRKGDYRSAAATMFAQGRRIGEMAPRAGEFRELVSLQCQAYLAAANALALVEKKHAWVAVLPLESADSVNDRSGKRRKLTYHIPDDEYAPGSRPAEIVGLDEIRREYTIALARLQLSANFAEVERTSFGLDAEAIVALFFQVAEFDRAFAAAKTLAVDMSTLFGTLTERCVGLALHPHANHDVDWIAVNDEAATWEGSLASKAWKLLERHLVRHDGEQTSFRYSRTVLERSLDLNPQGKVPTFLTDSLAAHDAQNLIRIMLKYDRLEDAFRYSLKAVADAAKSAAQAQTTFATTLPYSLFDQLLAIPQENTASLSREELVQRQQELRRVLDERVAQLDKAQKSVLRAAR